MEEIWGFMFVFFSVCVKLKEIMWYIMFIFVYVGNLAMIT